MDLGRVGVWSGQARMGEPSTTAEMATALEELGYGALWIPGGGGGDILDRCGAALDATESLVVATGILNIWRHDAGDVAARTAELDASSGGRFLLGLGVSHEYSIGDEYVAPLTKMRSYLDALDGAGQPSDVRALAALRPKMLRLAAERSAGAHPYFMPPEHTVFAREALGDGPLLAPEQTVVLERDPSAARDLARPFVAGYLQLPNYANPLRDLGYTDDDLTGGVSDRVVDAVVAWGDAAQIASRVQAHLDAGADHVCIQVLGPRDASPVDGWRELAPALL